MRTSLLVSLVASCLLTACASAPQGSPSKHISQSGSLRVHPGLLGQPVPEELRDPAVAAAPAAAATEEAAPDSRTMKMDAVGQRSQRSVYFDYKSAALKADYDSVVQGHGRHLAANPKARVRIEGHADERGSVGYNQGLGEKRAESVRQRLIAEGANSHQVSVKSYGETRPKLKGHDEESWAENRRADIVYESEE